jgi:hypothetical protein
LFFVIILSLLLLSSVISIPFIIGVISAAKTSMDLLDNLLGGQGCGVDGTLSRNPMTAMVDRIFDSHAAIDNGAGTLHNDPQMAAEQGYLYEGAATMEHQLPGYNNQHDVRNYQVMFNPPLFRAISQFTTND